MLLSHLAFTCLLATAAAFAPAGVGRTSLSERALPRSSVPRCEAPGSFTRRSILAAAVGTSVGVSPAFAGYVTNLGIETTKPEDAELDEDLAKTDKVKTAIKNIGGYKTSAAALKAKFDADTNAVLIPSIRKEFDFSQVRDDLNIASAIFDDTTQLTIDRQARSILYDLTELESAARFKKGEDQTRTAKKVANVNKWFAKLDSDIVTFLKYFPA